MHHGTLDKRCVGEPGCLIVDTDVKEKRSITEIWIVRCAVKREAFAAAEGDRACAVAERLTQGAERSSGP